MLRPPVIGRRRARTRGQAIVEFALTLPVLLLLLLIAIDFGRAFLGWVALNNAARVGANYAAIHPNDWDKDTTYEDLMAANVDAINCEQTNAGNPPVFGPTKDPGELVTVNLDCDFKVVTPVISAVLGNGGIVTVSSSAAFPITFGCLAACPTGPPAPPPPPPPNNCRTVPDVVGLSVAGARAKWVSAGFQESEFFPPSGADDTRTVESRTLSEPPNTEGCGHPSEWFYASSMTVELEPLVTPKPTPTCVYVPNMRGIPVGDARDVWTDAGFTGAFLPTGNDARIVVDQVTTPASDPGDCLEPAADVTVSHGPGLPPPPPAPCQVPSLVNTSTLTATADWTGAGFDEANITFKPKGGKNGYTIQSQSLVGGTHVGCTASIEVSNR